MSINKGAKKTRSGGEYGTQPGASPPKGMDGQTALLTQFFNKEFCSAGVEKVTKRKRRNHSPGFKAKAAMAAIRGDKTMVEIAQEYDVHPNQIQEWKKRLITKADQLFQKNGVRDHGGEEEKVQELHAKIGELTMERDSLSKALRRHR